MAKKFSTPYGDGTYTPNGTKLPLLFSPPYGDGTSHIPWKPVKVWFSPPYGDGTEMESQVDEAL